jgi:hypothetical protein
MMAGSWSYGGSSHCSGNNGSRRKCARKTSGDERWLQVNGTRRPVKRWANRTNPVGVDFRITSPKGEGTAYGEAGNRYVGTAVEGVERATLSYGRKEGPGKGSSNTRARGRSSTQVPETLAVRPQWQRKTKEKEGGGEETKAKVGKTDPTAILAPD